MNDSDFNIEIENLNRHLSLFLDNIPPVLLQFENNRKTLNSIQRFTFGMLHRLLNSGTAIARLLPEYHNNAVYDFAIGILIRPIVLDGLIAMNLLRILKNSLASNKLSKDLIEELDEFCKDALADGLMQTLNYFNQLKKHDLVDENDLYQMFNNFSQQYSDFLVQRDGINTMPRARNKKNLKPNNHFEDLVNDPEMKAIGHNLYELYVIYSKYDHFGLLYFDVMDAEKELKNDRIVAAINVFVNHFTNLCDLLQRVTPGNEPIHRIYLLSSDYLDEKQKKRIHKT